MTSPSVRLVAAGICLHLLVLMAGLDKLLDFLVEDGFPYACIFCGKCYGVLIIIIIIISVRMFDLRHLEHSTIIYEDPTHTPLLRLAWNKQDPNYLATVAMDACEVIILDVRVPCTPVARLNNHRACVNGIAWAPHSSCHICTAGDDHQVTSQILISTRVSCWSCSHNLSYRL